MGFLIDSDILIYSLKGNSKVTQNFTDYENDTKSISIITYGELVYGASKSEKIEKNLAVVYRLRDLFPIINVDKPIIEIFASLKSQKRKTGQITDDMDLIIAATALCNNLILVTNNEKHFRDIEGLQVQNWSK